MKRLDRLVFQELIGPWIFGVAMFSSLLIAATYLGKIANYVAQGVSIMLIGKITLLILGPTLVKTFSMSTLLASLLAFGRLSGDSEIVAMRAAGASIYRIIRPVAVFSLAIAIIAFVMNDTLAPYAAKQSTSLMKELSSSIGAKATQPTASVQVKDGKVQATIQALDFSLATGTLFNVLVSGFDNKGERSFILIAKEIRYRGEKDWRIIGGAKMLSTDGQTYTEIKGDVWPSELPNLELTPDQMVANEITDPDYFTTSELREQLARTGKAQTLIPKDYRNRQYWFWNKFSVPLAALIFGVLGAALGIRSHRAGTATGFALAVGILFGYMMLAQFMAVWAMDGVFPSWMASFTPIVLGLIAAIVIMKKRNTG